MIQIQTKLKVNDNSGIKIGQCIKIYKSKVGKIGDTILISAKKLRLNQKKKVKIIKVNKPLGTRIFGPITSEFRKQKNFKILSLSSNIL